jgi:hypothetical protein
MISGANTSGQATPDGAYREFLSQWSGAPDAER